MESSHRPLVNAARSCFVWGSDTSETSTGRHTPTWAPTTTTTQTCVPYWPQEHKHRETAANVTSCDSNCLDRCSRTPHESLLARQTAPTATRWRCSSVPALFFLSYLHDSFLIASWRCITTSSRHQGQRAPRKFYRESLTQMLFHIM